MKTLIPVLAALLLLPSMANAEGEWDFKYAPYLWLMGVEGDVSTFPGAPTVPVDVDLGDWSDALGGISMLLEAKKRRHGVIFEFLYAKLESDFALIPAIDLNMFSTSRNRLFSGAYEYALHDKERTGIDVFAGVRYWKVDTTLDFEGGLGILAGQRLRNAESWYDPLIGVKGRTRLGDSRFFATGWLTVGGFDVGSEQFYDVSINIGYQWKKTIGITLGYRLLDIEYAEESFFYDVQQAGWGLGLIRSF